MNRNELEQWMKDRLGEQPFAPGEAGWEKLRAALPQQPAADPPRKARLPLLPVWARVAASVVLLAAAGAGLYLSLRPQPAERIAAHRPSTSPVPAMPQPAPAAMAVKTGRPVALTAPPPQQIGRKVFPSHHTHKRTEEPGLTISQPDPAVYRPDPTPEEADIAHSKHRPGQSIPGLHDPEDALPAVPQAGRSLRLGVTAQAGRATVGNMQYQLGVVARRRISGRLYAEAVVAVAATDVRYQQQSRFPELSAHAGGLTAQDRVAQYDYSRNVVSMAVAPNVSYQLLPRLSVSAGGSLSYNLNRSLELQQAGTLEQAAVDAGLVRTSQDISRWDVGLTGGASYQVGRRLSLSAQYRHGLSDYLYLAQRAVRNSGLNIGVKYLFTH